MEGALKGKRGKRAVTLAASVALLTVLALTLSVTVWAEERQPVGEKQVTQQTAKGLTIDYWEPQVGSKQVVCINDWQNDIHGDLFGTSQLGYWDAAALYASSVSPVNYAASHYYGVAALSALNPVYFGLQGPWYFNMTTPYQYVEEVVDISEAPEAAEFPEATYAVRYLYVFSGGHRLWGHHYCSNDAAEKAWKDWGYTLEGYSVADERPVKFVYRYLSPSDKKTPVARTVMSFPVSVGSTGVLDAVYVSSGKYSYMDHGFSWEAVAEGKAVTPAGVFDTLLIRRLESGGSEEGVEYVWLAQDLGHVASASSLPGEPHQEFGEATYLSVLKEVVSGKEGKE